MDNEQKILKLLETMQGDFKVMQGDFKVMQGDFKVMQGDFKTMQGDIKTMQGDIKTMQGDIKTMQGDSKTMQADIDQVRQSQTRMEYEFGEKLSALFDGHKMLAETLAEHTEILNEHTTRLQSIEEKVTGHDIKIEILDKTKANKRKAR